MAFFEWQDNYSVGVASLDAQHKIIIKLINQLDDAENENGYLAPILNRLEWYVQNHFRFEEALMRNAGFEDFDDHVKEHRDFEDWLKTNVGAVRAGIEIRDLSMSINEYLKTWLTRHILVTDMAYKDVLTAEGNLSATIASLTDELIKVLKDAHDMPGHEPIEAAMSLARDIKACTEGGRPIGV